MLKYFDLQALYEEMGEEEKADKLDVAIKEDTELFRISDNDYGTTAFFKEENEKSILKKYPNIKKTNISTFEEYLEDYLSDRFDDFEIGNLKIEDDVTTFIIETYKEMNFYIDDLWDSEDFDDEFEQINNRIVGELISITLNEVLEILRQSEYEPNWETILTYVPEAYKNVKITPNDTGVAKYIENVMNKKGYTKTWVANLCDINYKTFCDKLKRNSFDALELLKLGNALEIDLNELKDNVHRLTLPSKNWELNTKVITDKKCRPEVSIKDINKYEYGGFEVDNQLTNGYQLYIPYGLHSELFSAIQYAIQLYYKEISNIENNQKEILEQIKNKQLSEEFKQKANDKYEQAFNNLSQHIHLFDKLLDIYSSGKI